MLIDVTGVIIVSGNNGKDCPGNGEHTDRAGHLISCCCDECDYMMCCLPNACKNCTNEACPKK